MKIVIAILVVVAIVVVGGGWYWHERNASAVTFRTAEVSRGDMVPTISASGTVEPREVVDVGAQVQGQILSFGLDTKGKTIDYNSPVEADKTILARIDDSVYKADADTAAAALDSAKAGLNYANANLAQYQAKLEQAQSDWDRAQKLGPSDAISQTDYNTFKANYGIAIANVDVAKAAIEQAKMVILQDQAAVDKAVKNLGYCTIVSPVSGVVIDRRVNTGQTVVSSLNTPSLFLLAKDLSLIQVWVSVNEADIGKIYPGQPVTFGVDAFPGETFHGTVGKARLNATMTQNVVTYTVEVDTENPDLRLRPYMTANVQFEVTRHKDVLLVANAALRWYPQPENVAPDVRDALAKAQHEKEPRDASDAKPAKRSGSSTRPSTRPSTHTAEPRGHGTVWVVDGKYVRPIKVRTSYSDGLMTEITTKDDTIKEGMELVEGEVHAQSDSGGGTTNPFAPQPMFGRHGGR